MTDEKKAAKNRRSAPKFFAPAVELYRYRQMIYGLVHRELRGRYKASFLGFLWTFLNPLLQLLVYTVVFSTILRSDIQNYYLFLFVALIPWIFFSSALTGGASSVIAQKDMVKKIYFPREVLPISHVTTCFVNMLLSFLVIFAVILVSMLIGVPGVGINPVALLYLLPVMAIEYVMALGIGTLASAVTVYFRDLEHILGILAMAWQFLTPVVYSIDIVPEHLKPYFYLNPMTPVIQAYRDILYAQKPPHMSTLLMALGFGVFFLILGFFVFSKLKRHFAEQL